MQYMYCHLHATEYRGCSSTFVGRRVSRRDPANCLQAYEAFDGTWTRFSGHLRRGRAGHWRHVGSLTTAVPAALVLPRSGSWVDVDIPVRQDITNARASKLFLQECPNLPGGYECTIRRAEHVEVLHFAIGQPTFTSARARGAKDAPEIHTMWSTHVVRAGADHLCQFPCMQVDLRADEVLDECFKHVGEAVRFPDGRPFSLLTLELLLCSCCCAAAAVRQTRRLEPRTPAACSVMRVCILLLKRREACLITLLPVDTGASSCYAMRHLQWLHHVMPFTSSWASQSSASSDSPMTLMGAMQPSHWVQRGGAPLPPASPSPPASSR